MFSASSEPVEGSRDVPINLTVNTSDFWRRLAAERHYTHPEPTKQI